MQPPMSMLQISPVEIQELQLIADACSWEEVSGVLRSDDRRNYNINIQADFTAFADENEEKTQRTIPPHPPGFMGDGSTGIRHPAYGRIDGSLGREAARWGGLSPRARAAPFRGMRAARAARAEGRLHIRIDGYPYPILLRCSKTR